jgi:hypothetical protein
MNGFAPGPAVSYPITRRYYLLSRLRALVKFAVSLAVLAILIALVVTRNMPWQAPYRGPFTTNLPPNTLIADFGLQRDNLTRSILVSTGTTAVSAPTTLTAKLSSDLLAYPRLAQFPADQITLSATPAGPAQIQIVAILNPVTPYRVGDGLFKGTISVYTSSKILHVPIAVYLAPKSGFRALLAFLLLLLGAIFGFSVKWVTEALSSLAAARWRFDSIFQVLGGERRGLPTSAEDKLTEIRNRIKRQDLSDLDELFEPLESARGPLRQFSENIGNITDEIDHQEGLAFRSKFRQLPIGDVVREERRQVKTLRGREWSWQNMQDMQAILEETKQLGDHVKGATNAITQQRLDVLQLYQNGDFVRAYELLSSAPPPEPDSKKDGDRPTAKQPQSIASLADLSIVEGRTSYIPRWLMRRDARGIIQWMSERPRTLAAVASILVVAIVGLQLQYLNSTSFDGSLAQWLSLLLWAAIIELSGVSVLDVVGRLSGSGPAPRSGRT